MLATSILFNSFNHKFLKLILGFNDFMAYKRKSK